MKQKIFPPEGGWKQCTWYLVEVSYNQHNPVHKDLFYSGFLSVLVADSVKEVYPGGYNFLPAQRTSKEIHEVYYLKVIREVVSEAEFNSGCTRFMPDDEGEDE